MTKTLFLAAAVVCAAFLLVSCNNTTGNNSNATSNGNDASRSNNNNASKPADSKPTASAGEIGVPECDAYLKNYEACVSDKVPENMRATFKSQVEQARTSYKQAAATPQGKAALAASCKQAEEATKKALETYKCSW